MRSLFRYFAAVMFAVALFAVSPEAKAGGFKVGVLTCKVEGGWGFIVASNKAVDCVFRPTHYRWRDHYVGSINKIGADIGVTDGAHLVWVVFAAGHIRRGLPGGHVFRRLGGSDRRHRSRCQRADRRVRRNDQSAACQHPGADRPERRRRHCGSDPRQPLKRLRAGGLPAAPYNFRACNAFTPLINRLVHLRTNQRWDFRWLFVFLSILASCADPRTTCRQSRCTRSRGGVAEEA